MPIQRICIPLKTSSCGMFSRSLATKKIWSTVRLRALLASLVEECFHLGLTRCPVHELRAPFQGAAKQGCLRNMANPVGAKAREPYQNLDGESQLSESITSFRQRLAGGLESGSKPSLGQGGLGSCDHAGDPCELPPLTRRGSCVPSVASEQSSSGGG